MSRSSSFHLDRKSGSVISWQRTNEPPPKKQKISKRTVKASGLGLRVIYLCLLIFIYIYVYLFMVPPPQLSTVFVGYLEPTRENPPYFRV